MNREQALELVKENVKTDFLVKHMLATEAIMRGAAIELGENDKEYALTGLIHDIDFEQTKDNPEKHGLLALEILKGKIGENEEQNIRELIQEMIERYTAR